MNTGAFGETRDSLTIRWTVRPERFVRILLIIASGLLIASLTGQAIRFATGDGHLWGFTPKFNLDAEMNVPTWFASFLFLMPRFCWSGSGRPRKNGAAAARARRWHSLALVFLLCSIDEVAAIHEMLVDPVRKPFTPEVSSISAGSSRHRPRRFFGRRIRPPVPPTSRRSCAGISSRPPSFFFSGRHPGDGNAGRSVRPAARPDHFAYALLANTEEFLEMLGQI